MLPWVVQLLCHLYVYPFDLQESIGDANTSGKQLYRPAYGDDEIMLSGCKFLF